MKQPKDRVGAAIVTVTPIPDGHLVIVSSLEEGVQAASWFFHGEDSYIDAIAAVIGPADVESV